MRAVAATCAITEIWMRGTLRAQSRNARIIRGRMKGHRVQALPRAGTSGSYSSRCRPRHWIGQAEYRGGEDSRMDSDSLGSIGGLSLCSKRRRCCDHTSQRHVSRMGPHRCCNHASYIFVVGLGRDDATQAAGLASPGGADLCSLYDCFDRLRSRSLSGCSWPRGDGRAAWAIISPTDPFETFEFAYLVRIERPLPPTKPAVRNLHIVSIMILFFGAGYIRHPCQDAAESKRGSLRRIVQGV